MTIKGTNSRRQAGVEWRRTLQGSFYERLMRTRSPAISSAREKAARIVARLSGS